MAWKEIAGGCIMFFLATGSTVGQEVDVEVDGSKVNFVHQQPIIDNSRVLIPLRGTFEEMGASVVWHPSTRTVTASRGEDSVVLTIGEPRAKINGRLHHLDVAPRVEHGRTMIPLRFTSEALKATVEWKADEKLAVVSTGPSDNLKKDPVQRDFTTKVGVVRKARPGIYMQGSHRLESTDGELKALLSSGAPDVELSDYVDEQVRIKGQSEPTVEGDQTLIKVQSVERI